VKLVSVFHLHVSSSVCVSLLEQPHWEVSFNETREVSQKILHKSDFRKMKVVLQKTVNKLYYFCRKTFSDKYIASNSKKLRSSPFGSPV